MTYDEIMEVAENVKAKGRHKINRTARALVQAAALLKQQEQLLEMCVDHFCRIHARSAEQGIKDICDNALEQLEADFEPVFTIKETKNDTR